MKKEEEEKDDEGRGLWHFGSQSKLYSTKF